MLHDYAEAAEAVRAATCAPMPASNSRIVNTSLCIRKAALYAYPCLLRKRRQRSAALHVARGEIRDRLDKVRGGFLGSDEHKRLLASFGFAPTEIAALVS